LANKRLLDSRALIQSGHLLTVPNSAFGEIVELEQAFVRKGRLAGVPLATAPHLVVGPLFALFDERDFIVQHPKIAISGSPATEDVLRALALYISSSIAQYLLFFLSVRWGVDRRDLVLADVRGLPCPKLEDGSVVGGLATAHRELCWQERESANSGDLRAEIDKSVARTLEIPEHIVTMAREFLRIRMPMDKGQVPTSSTRPPTEEELVQYSSRLRRELEDFSGIPHTVSMESREGFVCCSVTQAPGKTGAEFVSPEDQEALLGALLASESQWVYVQRSLRAFERGRFLICKTARTVDWTLTAAIQDSDDIIAEVMDLTGG
jgi:hypothetical protein